MRCGAVRYMVLRLYEHLQQATQGMEATYIHSLKRQHAILKEID